MLKSKKIIIDAANEIRKLRTQISNINSPIAIVSMSCRFAGGADSPEAFDSSASTVNALD